MATKTNHLPMLFVALFLTISSVSAVYNKVTLSQSDGAACLDGSPPVLFIDDGVGANADKFLVFINGGGTCVSSTVSASLASCKTRSTSELGSSTSYGATLDVDDAGYLSTLQAVNPNFYDWTKVLVQYCDGFFSISDKVDPIEVDGTELYFRGMDNMKESFKYLEDNYDFYNKDTIVLTGGSAGAMTTVYWIEYLADKVVSSQLYAIPDSGFYPMNYRVPTFLNMNIVELAMNAFAD